MPEWTFLTNHALVLSYLAKQPSITAREISIDCGITERSIRKIIANLDEAGYISKRRVGRGMRYKINPHLLLRHDTYNEIVIGDFLQALGWKGRRRRQKSARNSSEASSSKSP